MTKKPESGTDMPPMQQQQQQALLKIVQGGVPCTPQMGDTAAPAQQGGAAMQFRDWASI